MTWCVVCAVFMVTASRNQDCFGFASAGRTGFRRVNGLKVEKVMTVRRSRMLTSHKQEVIGWQACAQVLSRWVCSRWQRKFSVMCDQTGILCQGNGKGQRQDCIHGAAEHRKEVHGQGGWWEQSTDCFGVERDGMSGRRAECVSVVVTIEAR